MKFVGVREFKEDVVKYLNEGSEIVVMKRKRAIARLTPVEKNSPEIILLEIGRVLSEAGLRGTLITTFTNINSWGISRIKYGLGQALVIRYWRFGIIHKKVGPHLLA